MRKQKKGWIRIAEAVAAILLLTSIVLIFAVRTTSKSNPSDAIYTLQKAILDDLARNETMRAQIISMNPEKEIIHEFLRVRLPGGFNFNYSICNPKESCYNSAVPAKQDVYVDDIVISPLSSTQTTKKFTFFIWIE